MKNRRFFSDFSKIGYLSDVGTAASDLVTGEHTPENPYAPAYAPALAVQATEAGITRDMGTVPKFLTDTALSAGQSLANMPMGAAGLINMGLGAATQTAQNKMAQGATREQALTYATVAGAIEVATEKIPFEQMTKIFSKSVTKATAKEIVKDVLKNMGTEATEEAISNVADNIADRIIFQDKSEYEQYAAELIEQGVTKEEAYRKAFLKLFVEDTATSALGGAVSGLMLGSVPLAINGTRYVNDTIQTGKEYRDAGAARDLVREGLKSDSATSANKYAQKLDSKDKSGKSLSNWNIGRQVQKNAAAINAEESLLKSLQKNTGVETNVVDDIPNANGRFTPNKGEAAYSIQQDADGNKYVKIVNDVLKDVPKNQWAKAVSKWLNQNIQGRSFTALSDGDVIKANRKLTSEYSYGRNSKSLLNTEKYDAKMNLAGNIDEAIGVSEKTAEADDTRNADGSLKHSAFAKDGWDYRTFSFEYNGKKYTADLNVANSDNGKVAYDVTKIEEVSSKGSRQSGEDTLINYETSSTDNISDSGENVKKNFRGRVDISSNADTSVPATAGHEFTHAFKVNAPEAYSEFENYILQAAEETNAAAVNNRISELKRKFGYTDEVAREEVAAEVAENFLRDRDSIDDLIQDNPTLADKISQAITSAKARLKTAVSSPFRNRTGVELTYSQLNRAEKLWSKALKAAETSESASGEVKHSAKENVTETNAFKAWFGDWENDPEGASKVVNADGTPKVMYRGDSNDINVFDRRKSKPSNLYGRGFYFTDSREQASVYGNAKEYYLDIKHPLGNEQTISREQIVSFLEAVAADEDEYDLYNYGQGATPESIADGLYGKSDFEMMQDVSATAIGDLVAATELFNDVNGTDYDGFILPTETVVSRSEQIKSATDNAGTFDRSNPDVKYSMKENEDYGSAYRDYAVTTPSKLATEIMEKYDLAGLRHGDIKESLNEIWELITHPTDTYEEHSENLSAAIDKMVELGHEIAEAQVDEYASEEYTRLKNHLKGTSLKLAAEDKSDVRSASGAETFNEFRKRNFGRIKLTNTGIPLDSYYQELSQLFPEYFNAERETHPAEQLARIEEVLDELRKPRQVSDEQLDEEGTAIALELFDRIITQPGNAEDNDLSSKRNANIFAHAVDNVFSGNMPTGNVITIGDTPKLLQKYGAGDLPITINQSTMYKIAYPTGYFGAEKQGHNLGIPALKQLPNQIANPMAILTSNSQDNSLILLTAWEDTEGSSVIVPLHLDKNGAIGFSNEVASAYGKENIDALLTDKNGNSTVKYTKNNKDIHKLLSAGLQLPGAITDDTLVKNSISRNAENVNTKNKDSQRSVQTAQTTQKTNRTNKVRNETNAADEAYWKHLMESEPPSERKTTEKEKLDGKEQCEEGVCAGKFGDFGADEVERRKFAVGAVYRTKFVVVCASARMYNVQFTMYNEGGNFKAELCLRLC